MRIGPPYEFINVKGTWLVINAVTQKAIGGMWRSSDGDVSLLSEKIDDYNSGKR